LLERGIPIDDINYYSGAEKGPGRPPHWEMAFWWTRKPLAGARAIIAASLLPDNAYQNMGLFLNDLFPCRNEKKTVHSCNPSPRLIEKLRGKKLLDPFAGFGSIPLEASRLGVDAVAVEMLPTAYVFLKAVLEYPRLFSDKFVEVDGKTVKELGLEDVAKQFSGKREVSESGRYRVPMLIYDVARWGSWVISRLREDPVIRELYDADVYIGTWEVKCPHCGRWTPIVGNWWLARVGGANSEEEEEGGRREKVFERLAWMEPQKVGSEIIIKIRDLNRELNRESIRAGVNPDAGIVTVKGTVYRVPRPNIDAKKKFATCLHCGNQIQMGYIREALRDWSAKLEQYLSGMIDLNKLINESLARPRPLVKVKIINGNLVFEPATREDDEKLWKAAEELRKMWGDPDIPIEQISVYETKRITPILGANRWYQFFNPRQLLTLIKLVKLIRQVGHLAEEEKLKEGWNTEDAKKYAEAVTTYLAIALVRYVDFNSIVTAWNPGYEIVQHSLAVRGIAMQWNWSEGVPLVVETGTFKRNIENITNALLYLINAVSGSSSSVRVLLDDATSLSKLEGDRFDVIATDPPYRDDVAYSELSDLYYVWLKRALSDVADVGGVLVRKPRFSPEAFFDEFGNEIDTQWKRFAAREISEVEERSKLFGNKNINDKKVPVGSFDYFKYLLTESFKAMVARLKDDGILVTYYAHTSPDAWEALLEAGWQRNGLRISAAYALATESPQRVTARGATTLDMSIVVAWRRGASGEALADEVYAKAVELCSEEASRYRRQGYDGVNLFVAVLGCALSQFTQYRKIVGVKGLGELVERYIYPATAAAIAKSLAGAEAKLSPVSQFYLLAKVLIDRGRAQRRRLDRTSAVILSIGTRATIDQLGALRVIEKADGDLTLLEPAHSRDARTSIEELLREKGLNPQATMFRTAVDVLHVLEYLALVLKSDELKRRVEELRTRSGAMVDEAIGLAKILATALPIEEVEGKLAKDLLDSLGVGGLFEFAKG
jgi:putative DNA methylase